MPQQFKPGTRLTRDLTRRRMIGSAAAAAAALAAPVATPVRAFEADAPDRRLRIIVAGAHPGDPEAGCGGVMARYAKTGNDVIALYLTRGEAGVADKSAAQAAAIRSAEALEACRILGAKAQFVGQIDAATEVNAARQAEFTRLIEAAAPDVLFTQWPIDTHPDHRVCASLSIGAWISLKRKFALYYYEVDLGSDTQCFRPAHYVDVSSVEPLKRDACMAHASQNPNGFYNRDHVPMMRFRGMESGRKLAEAFILHDGGPTGRLPDDRV